MVISVCRFSGVNSVIVCYHLLLARVKMLLKVTISSTNIYLSVETDPVTMVILKCAGYRCIQGIVLGNLTWQFFAIISI